MQAANLPLPPGTASGVIANGAGRLLWHSAKETSGAAVASYNLLDGDAPDARLVLPVTLAAGASIRDYMGRHGIPFERGLYFAGQVGAIAGNVVIELDDNPGHFVTPVVVVATMATIIEPIPTPPAG